MKLRIARKLLFGRSSYGRRCLDLRPPFIKGGKKVYPSHDNICKIAKARTVYLKHLHHSKLNRNF